jgi:hypothetical protein
MRNIDANYLPIEQNPVVFRCLPCLAQVIMDFAQTFSKKQGKEKKPDANLVSLGFPD